VQTGMMDGTIVAFREINEWKFLRPVFIGDTIFAELEVVETKAYKRIGNGAVVIECSVYNHKGEMVMKGKWTALILLKGVS
jgi:acyl dehydratase